MSGLGERLHVVAEDIRPGDFTTFDGFRQAVDVTPVLSSWGRGRKRVVDQLTGVKLTRCDGTEHELPAGAPATFKVYRQAA